MIGTGDGAETEFQLIKTYGETFAPYVREILKPVDGTLVVAVDGTPQTEDVDYTADYTSGVVTFESGSVPGMSDEITAGFEFDVPVRFDSDQLSINLDNFSAGQIPNIAIVEIRL